MVNSIKIPETAVEAIRRALEGRGRRPTGDAALMPAAVFILLYPKDGEYCILLNKRSQQVEHHKGEISFPGGARDPEDSDFLATALREVHEEMGIRPEDVTVLGQLDDVETRSRFGVRVFVGTIPYPYPFRPSAREIAEVLEVPLGALWDIANLREEARWVEGETRKAYSYVYGAHLIFGATAQMVTQFLDALPESFGR